jgi:hypothetical protein
MAQQIMNWALAQKGVSSGRVDIVQEIISLYSVYEEQLEKLQHSSMYVPGARNLQQSNIGSKGSDNTSYRTLKKVGSSRNIGRLSLQSN